MFGGFGLTVGFILGVFRGKWSWAWTTALGAWAILFVWTLVVAAGMRILKSAAKIKLLKSALLLSAHFFC
jgi:hypothetical protein